MNVPAFSLPDQDGRIVTPAQWIGKRILLYCYPKADTPGCTKQACGLRDNIARLRTAGITVVGISPDDPADLKRFAQKYSLPFTLLADPSTATLQTLGVWGEKQFMGRRYMGVLRTSFLIAPDGSITKRFDGVNPETHASMILDELGVSTAAQTEMKPRALVSVKRRGAKKPAKTKKTRTIPAHTRAAAKTKKKSARAERPSTARKSRTSARARANKRSAARTKKK